MSLDRLLTKHGRFHRFSVSQAPVGWEVCEEEDAVVVRRTNRRRWQLVECDALLFDIRARALATRGWTEGARFPQAG